MLLKKKNQIPEQAENHGSWSTLALKTHYFSFDFSHAIRAQQHWLCSCISKQSEDPKFQNPSYRNQVWWHFVGLNFVESSWWHVYGHGPHDACLLALFVGLLLRIFKVCEVLGRGDLSHTPSNARRCWHKCDFDTCRKRNCPLTSTSVPFIVRRRHASTTLSIVPLLLILCTSHNCRQFATPNFPKTYTLRNRV